MKPAPFEVARARDAAEACALLGQASGSAKVIAGGQSIGPMLNLRLARHDLLIDVRHAEELRGIAEEEDAVVYGAAITHAEVEDGRVPDATGGWLSPLARGIAYRAVRNRGTVGGSIAHADPAGDWVTIMTALGAEAILQGPGGRRAVGMSSFCLGPFSTALAADEILLALRVPRRSPAARWGYWKFCRKTGEYAKSIAAVLVDPDRDEARIVLGAAERPPLALPEPDALLMGEAEIAGTLQKILSGMAASSLAIHAAAVRRAIALSEVEAD